MVDKDIHLLSSDARPLRSLFLDLNAYFASVEQQENPELRGKPVGVGPPGMDSGTIIAASYEAKRYGVKTGLKVGEAMRLCPQLIVRAPSAPIYVHYHHKIKEAVESVLPIERVCSIDEMHCSLLGEERRPEQARLLAATIKQRIREQVGECMTCSVGIAPNPFVAKIGTDMQKPDGLVVLEGQYLPEALFGLGLTDFPGINKRMAARLGGAGIFTAKDLCTASRERLRTAFRSYVGERWWYLLRGFEVRSPESGRKSLGHSHVLPPNLRHAEGCRQIILRLIQKACARMRSLELCASNVDFAVIGWKQSWHVSLRIAPTNDTVKITERFVEAWEATAFDQPSQVGVTFSDLVPHRAVTKSLFDPDLNREAFNHAVDSINQKFGKNTVYLAGLQRVKDRATEKIAFNKTWLFSEGKGDNDWVNPFRGVG